MSSLHLCVILCCGLFASSDIEAWRAGASEGAPLSREASTVVWTGGEFIVWGGRLGDEAQRSGARYDPTANLWRPLPTDGAPLPRAWHSAVWTGTEMIVWGGDGASGELADGAAYSPSTDRWRTISADGAPKGRGSHTAVWSGTEMIIWAGVTEQNSFLSGGCYDPTLDRWRPIRCTLDVEMPPRTTTAVWTGEEMLVWGGINGGFVLDTGYRYDPKTDSWRAMSREGAPSPRAGHVAVWTGSDLLIWGGRDRITAGNPLADGGRYSPADDRWTPIPAGDRTARDGPAVARRGEEVLILGGRTREGDAPADGSGFAPATSLWRSISLPATCRPLAAAATKTGIIICGTRGTGSRLGIWRSELPASPERALIPQIDAATSIVVATVTDSFRYRGQGGGTIGVFELRVGRVLAGERPGGAIHFTQELTAHESDPEFVRRDPGKAEGEIVVLLRGRRVAEGDLWYDLVSPETPSWWPTTSSQMREIEALLPRGEK